MKKLIIAASLSTLVLFSSCASLFTKSTSTITVDSDPQGAKLRVINKKGDEVYSGKTPAVVKVNNSSGYMSGEILKLIFTNPGYEQKEIYINSKIEGWYWGNILFGGLIGMLVIDPLTGAMYKLDTESVNVALEEDNKADKKVGSLALHIIDINTLSDGQKSKLVKLSQE